LKSCTELVDVLKKTEVLLDSYFVCPHTVTFLARRICVAASTPTYGDIPLSDKGVAQGGTVPVEPCVILVV